MALKLAAALLLCGAAAERACFSEPRDFASDGLQGRWPADLAHAGYDANGVWAEDASGFAVGNVTFGDLRCPLEAYPHACGAGLGRRPFNWTDVREISSWDSDRRGPIVKRFPKWRQTWEQLGRRGWAKQAWRPKKCALPKFDGARFAEALQGRKVIFWGDSTMQQLFVTVACLLPPEVVEEYLPKWVHGSDRFRLETGSSVKLKRGGSLEYIDGRLEANAFFQGGPETIVLQHSDLHTSQSNMRAKLETFAAALKREQADAANFNKRADEQAWSIFVQGSIQHFRSPDASISGCHVDGTFTQEVFAKSFTCGSCSEPPAGRQFAEDKLNGRVAVLSNEPLRSAGDAHPTLFYTDCTHFCQPGPQVALAAALSAIVLEYKNGSEFHRRVTMSTFWQERFQAEDAAALPVLTE
ncbi:hypothetical protein M885DRAFT_520561 [Pelagophyceae sp. CCMP2097]|nr:hypothetical protein M885DRAFT_520561 [Pelagophyceae sp. CCMP2097]